jgi:hypothetical protein
MNLCLRKGSRSWVAAKKTVYVDTLCGKGARLRDVTLDKTRVKCRKCKAKM